MIRHLRICSSLLNQSTLSRNLSLCSRACGKLDFEDSVDVKKTTVTFLTRGTDQMQVSGCVKGGFMFQEKLIMGSVALIPNTVLKWKPESVEEITEKSLILFSVISPKLELLVVGTGNITCQINPEVVLAMKKRGIHLEIQGTRNACGTFNLLRHERPGLVAAALLPLVDDGKPYLSHENKRKRSKASIIK